MTTSQKKPPLWFFLLQLRLLRRNALRGDHGGKAITGPPGEVVGTRPIKCRKRTTQTAFVSLETHRPSSSSDHVSTTFCTLILCSCTLVFLYSFALHLLMQRFLSLGTDCVNIQEAADKSKGIFPCSYCSRFVFIFSILFAHIF
jgi:hypothetical protein